MTNFHVYFFYSDELHWVHEMRLEFNAPPNMCNVHGHPMEPSKMNANGEFIDVIFDTGFHRERLLWLLSEMVCWQNGAIKINLTNIGVSYIFFFSLVSHLKQ